MTGTREVESHLPRAKAGFHTILPSLAFVFDVPLAVALVGVVMAVSVLGGPRLSLFGRLYSQSIKPLFRIKDGAPEAAAPHRFAETIGAAMLLSASVLLVPTGGDGTPGVVGWGATLIVVALAALNWLAGVCVGCRIYPLWLRLRGRLQEAAG